MLRSFITLILFNQVTNTCHHLYADRSHWKAAAPMSIGRARAAHYTDGSILIVAGGVDSNGAMLNSVEMLKEGSWTVKSSIPSATEG